MAYMNQAKKATIKAALDKILKPRGVKYSLRVRDHMAIVCTITAGPIDFIENWKAKQRPSTLDRFIPSDRSPRLDHLDVNQYWIEENFSGDVLQVMRDIMEAMKSAAWYDKSDAQIDYFETAYYYHVKIGTWEKAYKYTGPTPEQFIDEHFKYIRIGD
mgnify:CR=1 FL=1